MLNYLISTFFLKLIILEIEILSLKNDRESCQTSCNDRDGHLPYLFEGIGSKFERPLSFTEKTRPLIS